MKKGENIYKRKDGRWEGRFKKGRNRTGTISYGYVYGQCYSEVRERLSVKKAQYIMLLPKRPIYNGTVEEWATFWLEHRMRTQIKVSTYTNYRLKITRHIIPAIGSIPLTQVSRTDIERLIQVLVGKRLSASTIQNTLQVLKSCMKQALQEEKMTHNPCLGIQLPPIKKTSVHALTVADQKKLETVALAKETGTAVIIALYTGMRIGEISGLRWTDIDMENNIIHVRRTISRIPSTTLIGKTELHIDLPKTHTSLRELPLPMNLKKYLVEKKKSSTGRYVISCKAGVTEPRIISYRFKRLLQQAQLPSIHFHSLRHTFATRCLEQGVDVATVSKLLGHASVKMTLDTYTDSLWDSRQAALTKLDQHLSL